MSGFGNTCIVGIVEKMNPSRRREGFREESLPTSIPEKYLYRKTPRKDRIIAATRYESPDSDNVDVAIAAMNNDGNNVLAAMQAQLLLSKPNLTL